MGKHHCTLSERPRFNFIRGGASQQSPLSLRDNKAEEIRVATTRVGLALFSSFVFGLGVLQFQGRQVALEYAAAFLVEMSLSVDHIFVFILLFDTFRVPISLQPRALQWGVLGAVAMRAVLVSLSPSYIRFFRGVVLVFAMALVVSSYQLFCEGFASPGGRVACSGGPAFLRQVIPSVDRFDGERFFTDEIDSTGKRKATPLLLCLVCIELSDFVFAVDSIPAVLSITSSKLVVLSSNAFALLGLRSAYTLLVHGVNDLPYLRPAVALILGFIGLKMGLEFVGISTNTGTSLGVIASLLGTGVALSVLARDRPQLVTASSEGSPGASCHPLVASPGGVTDDREGAWNAEEPAATDEPKVGYQHLYDDEPTPGTSADKGTAQSGGGGPDESFQAPHEGEGVTPAVSD